ncbi:MAG: outer membrane beta-barrel protein [Treponema sp.]
MKKIVAAVFAAVSMAAAASALDLSAGALFDYTFDHEFGKKDKFEVTSDFSMLGFKAFFDAQYAQVQLGVNSRVGKTKGEVKYDGTKVDVASGEFKFDVTYFNIGLFGKYPFAVGPAKIYPMLGFDFDLAASVKLEGIEISNKADYNTYWGDAGVGADIFVTKNLYIKPQLLVGFQMNQIKTIVADKNAFKVNAGIGAGWKF